MPRRGRSRNRAIPLVDISGGLHASEIAGSQHTPQLAYELLSRASEPATKEILDNAILFLWPSINPDGQDIVVNWCRESLAGRNPPPMELYQKYIGHDNNRDSYMLNVVESRVIARTWREWEPQIIYVHHQSSPFPTRIWIPPFADPDRPVRAADHVAHRELDRHAASRRSSTRRASPARCTCSRRSTRITPATSTTCRCTSTSRRGGRKRRAATAASRARRPWTSFRRTIARCCRRRCTTARGRRGAGR